MSTTNLDSTTTPRAARVAFGAAQAMQYLTFLTIGYMLARGLAKSGSHSRSSDND